MCNKCVLLSRRNKSHLLTFYSCLVWLRQKLPQGTRNTETSRRKLLQAARNTEMSRRKLLQGTRNTEMSTQKSLQGRRKLLQAARNTETSGRKSLQGRRKLQTSRQKSLQRNAPPKTRCPSHNIQIKPHIALSRIIVAHHLTGQACLTLLEVLADKILGNFLYF